VSEEEISRFYAVFLAKQEQTTADPTRARLVAALEQYPAYQDADGVTDGCACRIDGLWFVGSYAEHLADVVLEVLT
jgi:hypothetical protein